MITMSNFGTHGRLANQLFQYASLIGISEYNETGLALPEWQYSKYFEGKFPILENTPPEKIENINEAKFEYLPFRIEEEDKDWSFNLNGYFQSEKYFEHCVPEIKKTLTFDLGFAKQTKQRMLQQGVFNKPTIAIHIRRGDYVNNGNYAQLPITYYFLALLEHFPNWRKCNVIIFSDDIPYCKVHWGCFENVFFSEGTDIEDLYLMTQCTHFILSNSSFSWWGAWLGERLGTKIVRPTHHFDGKLKEVHDIKDLYPERWVPFNHKKDVFEDGNIYEFNKKIDLTDITFTIPIRIEHQDRKENLDLTLQSIRELIDTNIIIGEQYSTILEERYIDEGTKYIKFLNMDEFHRTKMLNDMALQAITPYIFNWDVDIIISPLQIYEAIYKLRQGASMVYPYKWAFARMPRNPWYYVLKHTNDIGFVGDTKFNGMNDNDDVSYGGAVAFNKQDFIEGGMENENIISFGAEDTERYIRFTKLGYNVERTLGTLYHMNHYIGINSSTANPYFQENRKEARKIKFANRETIKELMKDWQWLNPKKLLNKEEN